MKVDVLLGLQWGDEGKGKLIDVLAPEYDVIARFQEATMQGTHWNLTESNMYCIPFLQEFSEREN